MRILSDQWRGDHSLFDLGVLVGVLVLVATLAGCGSINQSTESVPGSGGTVASTLPSTSSVGEDFPGTYYLGPITHSVDYADQNVNLDPPPPSATPQYSWQTAVGNCLTGAAVCTEGFPVVVSLAVGNALMAGQINPDGSITPAMNHSLVLVLTQSGIPCSSQGPAGDPGIATKCTFLSFVDAMTGDGLYAISGPMLVDPNS